VSIKPSDTGRAQRREQSGNIFSHVGMSAHAAGNSRDFEQAWLHAAHVSGDVHLGSVLVCCSHGCSPVHADDAA
jgi:hypothetical protein